MQPFIHLQPKKGWICFALTHPPRVSRGEKALQRGPSNQVTELLVRWRGGDKAALDSLMPLVYTELRRIANHYLQGERSDHTLQRTALVHEAYVRMTEQALPQWQNRAHFFAVAAQLMRQILVDHARSHRASKRGGDVCKLALEDAEEQPKVLHFDIVALDDALKSLALMDEQQSRVVELKFFAGLSFEEAALALNVSSRTLKRDWDLAKRWL